MRLPYFCLLVSFVLAFAMGSAFADQARVTLPDNSVKDFDGVVVISLQRDGSGNGTFMIQMPDGQTHPVELARVIAISFGEAGEGRQFDIVVNTEDGPRPYVKSTLRHYTNGVFAASPFGDTAAAALPAANLVAISAAGSATAAPGSPDDLFAEPSGNTDPNEPSGTETAAELDTSGAGSGRAGSGGLSGQEKDPRKVIDQMFSQMRANGTSPALVMTFGALFFLYMGLVAFTSIWTMIHAFTKGNIGWGLGIIATTILGLLLCCCSLAFMGICSLTKSYYMRQYETPYRAVIAGIVTTETLVYVILSVLQWFVRR